MKELDSYSPLVERSRNGDKESLQRLIEQVRGPLVEYLCRLTASEEEAQDLAQECLLDMVKVIGQLREADRFWPWLRRIAFNKACDRHQESKRCQSRPLAEIQKQLEDQMSDTSAHRGLANLISRELSDAVWHAIQALKPEHRQVLVLRCYEEMDYPEIARTMNRRSFSIRMLFARAKRQLHRELSRRGFGKEMLVVALVLYGKMTAQTQVSAATLTISPAALKIGMTETLAAALLSHGGLIVTTGILVLGGAAVSHVVMQNPPAVHSGIVSESTDAVSAEATAEPSEAWFYFPEGPTGPVVTRFLTGERSEDRICRILQNGASNFRFDPPHLEITNHRHWKRDLSVQLLPTDSRELKDFIESVEGKQRTWHPVIPSTTENLWIVSRYPDDATRYKLQAGYHPDALREMYFRPDWGANITIQDQRDKMHKQGWCSFRIEGQVLGKTVSGRGQMPLVYALVKSCSPWLHISVGDRQWMDRSGTATLYHPQSQRIESYPEMSFFKGMARPWMGLHTLDIIRRDAAEQKIPFETRLLPSDENIAEVTLIVERPDGVYHIRYFIDLEKDLVNRIQCIKPDYRLNGFLNFHYLEDPLNPEPRLVQPVVQTTVRLSSGQIRWLVDLFMNSPDAPTQPIESGTE